jgi:hypothetical protein
MFAPVRSSCFHCATNSQFMTVERKLGRDAVLSKINAWSPKIALPFEISVCEKSALVSVAW